MSMKPRFFVIMSAVFGLAPSASANDELYRPLPAVTFSIGTSFDAQLRDGPLFHKTVKLLDDVSSGVIAHTALGDATARTSYSVESGLQTVSLTADLIQAILASCHRPISFHEELSWVQFSWVCRTDGESPLADYIVFENSPELNFTAWYENGQIARIRVGEVIKVPGQRLMRMDAYRLLADS